MNLLSKPSSLSDSFLTRLQYLCLLAAGALEFLSLALAHDITNALLQRALLVFVVLFWIASAIWLHRSHRKCPVLLPFAMVLWFVIVQLIPHEDQLQLRHFGFFFAVYLLAYPYAALTDDVDKQTGLKAMARYLIAASLVLVFYGVLLLADLVPAFLESEFELCWNGARIYPMMHPNIAARVFLIGIAFCLGFCFKASKKHQKVLLLVATALQFLALSLTNSRSTIPFACLLIGGTVFFAIFKGTPKQFLLGAAAGLAVAVALLLTYQGFFQWNSDRMYAAQSQAQLAESVQASAQTLHGGGQGTLAEDLTNMNGRTKIWRAAFHGLKENPSILIRGADSICELVGRTGGKHLHNGWLQTFFQLGLPALAISLVFTVQAIWTSLFLLFSGKADLWKKIIAMLMLCLLASATMEPSLFCTDGNWHFTDFVFFLCLGYAHLWQKQLSRESSAGSPAE